MTKPTEEPRPTLSSRFRFLGQQFNARWKNLRLDWGDFIRHPLGLIGTILIAIFALMAFVHPLLMSTVWKPYLYDPVLGFDSRVAVHPAPFGIGHWLGTDAMGRDVFSQLLFGAQVSFLVGILAAVVTVTLSTLSGGVSGYYEGILDAVLMAVADVFVLLPAPIVLLIFGLIVKLDWWEVALFYGLLTGLGGQSIVVKSYTLSIKIKPYIDAARISGGGRFHIFRRHILPALKPLILVHGVFTVVGAVLTESLLSFFSRTNVEMSWGTMIWFGQQTFRTFNFSGQWNAIAPPAIALMLFCSAFYLVGRALDETLNPKLRKR